MERFTLADFKYWPQIVMLSIIALAFITYYYYAYYNTRTTDAFIAAQVVNISPLVSGPVTKVYVKDNQHVKKGDKLLEIDVRPYEYALQKAQADLNQALVNRESDKISTLLQEQRSEHGKSAQGAHQTENIVQVEHQLKSTQQTILDNRIAAAQAMLAEANYLYSNTTVLAPADGYVSNVQIHEGEYVQQGQGVFALIETKKWWVFSRYRETAIRLIKPGDKATITLLMYPGKVFHGHVESISWGINREEGRAVASSTLTNLQPTENWVKIAHRFPVRITIDDVSPQYPLRVGASATTTTYG